MVRLFADSCAESHNREPIKVSETSSGVRTPVSRKRDSLSTGASFSATESAAPLIEFTRSDIPIPQLR